TNPQALGTTDAATFVASGATLELAPAASGGTEIVKLNGDGFNGQGALLADNTLTWAGQVEIDSLCTAINTPADASTLTLTAGLIGRGSNSLHKKGVGRLAISGTPAGDGFGGGD